MLGGGWGGFEPSIVGEVDDDLGGVADEFPSQARDSVFKTDRWNDLYRLAPKINFKGFERFTCAERAIVFLAGLLFVDGLEKREGV